MGSLADVWRDPLSLFMEGRERYGPTVAYRFGPYRFVLIHRPEDVRRVMLTHRDNYPKSPSYKSLELVLGQGLVTSSGEFWRRQRKLAQPAFHHRSLVGLADTMTRCTAEMLEGWATEAAESGGHETDLHEAMMRLTLRIVGHALFSTELADDAEAIGPAVQEALEYANRQVESMFLLPRWLPTAANRRFAAAKATLDEVVFKIIAERRAELETDPSAHERPARDLLDMLMRATDESGTDRMTDAQLRDEVMTLVLAGHETTANALTWLFVLLGRHPEAARRLVREVDEVCGERPPSFQDLSRLTYTSRVVDEAMRLYPPVWIFERQAREDDELGGHRIPAGTIVGVCTWTLHRDPTLWDDPDVFDPDRFTEERSHARDRYAYVPFGAGPRQCIGNAFAKMEAKLIVAAVVQRFGVQLVHGQRIEPSANVTLRPKHGVRVRIRPRADDERGAAPGA